MCLRQHDYGIMWVGRMEAEIGKKLVSKDTPGFANGRMFAQGGGPGMFAMSARSFVSACMYAGRHTMPELVEPCNFLSCFFNDWCIMQDAGLLQLFGYWKTYLECNNDTLEIRICVQDAKERTIVNNYFSDADHASNFARKSTSAGAAMLEGKYGTKGLLDYGCKLQPSASKSSGESETVAVDQVAKALNEDEPTKLEIELINRSADKMKATVAVCQRLIAPIGELIEWVCNDRYVIRSETLYIDASVAVSIAISGNSRALQYVRKTQAVDVAWMHSCLVHLGVQPKKVDTSLNISDLWTKAVTRATLIVLLQLIGRRVYLEGM